MSAAARHRPRHCLSQRGAAVRAIVCDVRNMRQVESAVREVVEWRGRVDILVNNAAIFPPGLLTQMAKDVWVSVIDTNLNGAFRMARACVPAMIRNRWGPVINVESPSGLLGMVTVPAYGTSKGALMAFTRLLAAEVGRFGVTVNGLCPGVVATEKFIETFTEEVPAAVADKAYRITNTALYAGSLISSDIYGEPRMYGLKLRQRF